MTRHLVFDREEPGTKLQFVDKRYVTRQRALSGMTCAVRYSPLSSVTDNNNKNSDRCKLLKSHFKVDEKHGELCREIQ